MQRRLGTGAPELPSERFHRGFVWRGRYYSRQQVSNYHHPSSPWRGSLLQGHPHQYLCRTETYICIPCRPPRCCPNSRPSRLCRGNTFSLYIQREWTNCCSDWVWKERDCVATSSTEGMMRGRGGTLRTSGLRDNQSSLQEPIAEKVGRSPTDHAGAAGPFAQSRASFPCSSPRTPEFPCGSGPSPCTKHLISNTDGFLS